MKYMVAVDIETTGLEPSVHGILEIGAILFDLNKGTPIDQFLVKVNPEGMVWSVYCLKLHWAWIDNMIERIMGNMADGLTTDELAPPIIDSQANAVSMFAEKYQEWCSVYNFGNKLTIAGKNFAGFDLQFLKAKGMRSNLLPIRCYDPAILFLEADDDKIPSLEECKERAGIPGPVKHTSLADCRDVIALIKSNN